MLKITCLLYERTPFVQSKIQVGVHFSCMLMGDPKCLMSAQKLGEPVVSGELAKRAQYCSAPVSYSSQESETFTQLPLNCAGEQTLGSMRQTDKLECHFSDLEAKLENER